MDFIFGTLATDDLKRIHHQTTRRGLQHRHELTPRDPLPGQLVTVSVFVGVDMDIRHVACYYSTDGKPPQGSKGVATHGTALPMRRVNIEWDTVTWGYITEWQAEIPAQADGATVAYTFSGWNNNGEEHFADYPDVKAMSEYAAMRFFANQPIPTELPTIAVGQSQVFAYHVDTFSPPAWAREAIIYHIFIDRFYAPDGYRQTDDLNQAFGGTLLGVLEKMDYITNLGINCLWLSPTFCSPTYHGYDVSDYYKTEPRLGGDDALRAVIEAAHARHIRVILDLPCNHISSEHAIFQEALANPDSHYRDWFDFDDSGYRTFFNVPSMPCWNVRHAACRDYLLDVGRYWLTEFGVDGFRLDHANGPGADFWAYFSAACKAVDPDCFIFGEVVDAPDTQRHYVGRLDGLLDFHLADTIRKVFADGGDVATIQIFLERHQSYFPANFILPTFLDNHDMNRFLHIVGNDIEKLKAAATLQFAIPAPPIIYYGTEVGVTQKNGVNAGAGLEASREPMLWGDDQNHALLAFYKQLIQQRLIK